MSSTELEAEARVLASLADTAFVSRYASMAAWTLLLYDHVLCLKQEVKLVWSRHWTFVNILYVLMRYGSFFGFTFCVMGYMATNVDDSFCRVWIMFQGYVGPTPWFIVQCVMAARVYALYDRWKTLLYLICSLFITQIVAMEIIWGLHYKYAMSFTGTPVPGVDFHVCTPTVESEWLFTWWIPPILFDTFICVLVLLKGVATHRITGAGFVKLIIRDSLIFYMGSLVIQFASLAIWKVGDSVQFAKMQSGTLFATVNAIVLCCRMVLSLRDYKPRMQFGTSMTVSVTTITNAFQLSVTRDWEGPDIMPEWATDPPFSQSLPSETGSKPRSSEALAYSRLGAPWPS